MTYDEFTAPETVKEIRASTGLSQIKFAAKFGIPRRTVEKWESNDGNPPPYLVKLLGYAVYFDRAEREALEEIE